MPAPETFRAIVVDHERHEPVQLRDVPTADLVGELLLEVLWSSLNFKDALASRPDGQVARSSPLVLGIDTVGVVRESGDARYSAGDVVIAHGNDLGAVHHGGLATWSRVSADWVVPVPAPLTPRETMILGTAGYTAGASILALERRGLTPADGPVLVTGATGGVGSSAIAMLARHGYTVHASTGKPDAADWLRSLGADEVVDREHVAVNATRPLARQQWVATVDSVGGTTLAGALAATRYGGAVAASGLTGDARLEMTVMPFILRGVALLGIDSTIAKPGARQAIWERIATDLRPANLEALVRSELTLDDVIPAFDDLLAGGARGRYLVRLAG